MTVRQAALAAAGSRFRPILMTTLAMIFGTLPIALSLGTSSGSRTSLGIVVVGGLIFAGVLTLYVIPAIYSFFSRPYKAKAGGEGDAAGVASHQHGLDTSHGFPNVAVSPKIAK
jgi:multidrug efflux pump